MKSKSKFIVWFSICTLSLLPCFTFCAEKNKEVKERASTLLFSEISQLYKTYTDSVETSNSIEEINFYKENFEKKITDINYSYPPNTDLEMTEEENDSIIKLNKKYKNRVEEKIREIGNTRILLDTDSIQ